MAGGCGGGLPPRDPAPVSSGGAKTRRGRAGERRVSPHTGAGARRPQLRRSVPGVARGCPRCCGGEERGHGRRWGPLAPPPGEGHGSAPQRGGSAEGSGAGGIPQGWHREGGPRQARRCVPGHPGAPGPALRRFAQPGPRKPPVTVGVACPAPPAVAPRGAPTCAAAPADVQPPPGSTGSAARTGGPVPGEGGRGPGRGMGGEGAGGGGGSRRGVGAGGVSRGGAGAAGGAGPRHAPRRADKIKACQGVGAGGGAHTPPGREIPIVCRPYIYRGLTAVVCRPRNLSYPHSRESGEGWSGDRAALLPRSLARAPQVQPRGRRGLPRAG